MNARRNKLTATVGVLLVGLTVSVSCTSEDRGTRDAPIDAKLQDNSAPYIVNGPDRFHGLALKCLGADLVVTHTREAAPVVVSNASICAPGAAEKIGVSRVGGYVGGE